MDLSQQNSKVIEEFYTAFSVGDAKKMGSLYAENATFEDPAFGQLQAAEARAMWSMLVERSKGQLQIEFSNVQGTGQGGSAHWEAKYPFGKTGRKVHNKIDAEFEIKAGKITKHIDRFNFWKWSSMALGLPGLLLGFTPIIKNGVRKNVQQLLKKYMEKHSL
ncbi:MAG: nuclear transport factor 2 family protein [Saprospiraceae bacterium]|nr:nuclear transport factor 2 family protein [Saprospiraceae bacterium]